MTVQHRDELIARDTIPADQLAQIVGRTPNGDSECWYKVIGTSQVLLHPTDEQKTYVFDTVNGSWSLVETFDIVTVE